MEIDLARLFADSEAGTLKAATVYERVCGTIPADMGAAGGDMALDANEDVAYFRLASPGDLASRLPAGADRSPSRSARAAWGPAPPASPG